MDRKMEQALDRCRVELEREGFRVDRPRATEDLRGARPDILAVSSNRQVMVYVVAGNDVDAPGTRSRLQASSAKGETRVFVEWPLQWRMLSNLVRWRIQGVPVDTW